MCALTCDELAPVTISLPRTISARLHLGTLRPYRPQVERCTSSGRVTLPRVGWDELVSALVATDEIEAADTLVHALGHADPEGFGW